MATKQRRRKIRRGFVWLAALLTFLWFAANSSFAPEALATGVLISASLAYLFTRKPGVWRDIRFSPKRAYHFVLYTGVFVVELVRANINMMRYVFAPRIDIKPGIVQDQDQAQNAGGAVGPCELHCPYAWFAGDRHRGRRPVYPLARRQDDRYGRSNPRDCGCVRRAFGENLWLKQSSSLRQFLIFLGVAFGVLRLIIGRTVVDRVAAVDMLTVVSISLIALYAHVGGRAIYLDVALVYGVLSFLAVLAIARYLEQGL